MIKLSRSKLELFLDCPRCFWLNINKKIKRPPSFPYTINSAIDALLKQEFDVHRENGTAHYLIKKYNIDAIPYKCKEINAWRHNFTGIQFQHKPTDFLVFGAVDDVWINSQEELIVVDYKATGAKEYKIYDSYKRQLEIYQWLLQQNGYKVSKTGYFLFAKVNKDGGFKEGKLSFDLFIEPQEGDRSWVESAIINARKAIDNDIPVASENCIYCQFIKNGGYLCLKEK
ncbi:MAG: PD-(D/E)XK nuclease family protein [Candidatus Omnitrophica bacterium]|nr:PD-(D/E)XK nuclease family protein [Candidatus Omnitrophota bacterium]